MRKTARTFVMDAVVLAAFRDELEKIAEADPFIKEAILEGLRAGLAQGVGALGKGLERSTWVTSRRASLAIFNTRAPRR
jgi:hypothetical protein